MGLDITAYKYLTPVENPEFDEYGELVNWDTQWQAGDSMKWSEKYFEGRGEGVDPDAVYTYEDSFGFRAGSYSGYGWWRDTLSNFSEGNSFEELINFADNEGVIGSIVSQKLYDDFKNNYDKAIEFNKTLNNDEWWIESYRDWMKAFDYARNNGAVDFH